MRLSPASRASCPRPKAAGIPASAALPARKGVKSYFGCSWGTVLLRSSVAQTPAAGRPPKAGRPLRGRYQTMARFDSVGFCVACLWLVSCGSFSRGENLSDLVARGHYKTLKASPVYHAFFICPISIQKAVFTQPLEYAEHSIFGDMQSSRICFVDRVDFNANSSPFSQNS
jgi:hypothetical protein